MVVENARTEVCREVVRKEEAEREDLADCWATNLEEQRSGALTMLLRAAALAKLRLAMALIAGEIRSLEGKRRKRKRNCTATTSQWLWRRKTVGGRRKNETELKPTEHERRLCLGLRGELFGVWPRSDGARIAFLSSAAKDPRLAHLCGLP
jgi:hypothetical protein